MHPIYRKSKNGCRGNKVPGLSCGVVWVITRLAVSVAHRFVTDRQTDRHTHTHTTTTTYTAREKTSSHSKKMLGIADRGVATVENFLMDTGFQLLI